MKFTQYLRTTFRKTFTFPSREVTHYFPGHMAKGMKQMERKLKDIDCIIEVHDARIPMSGRNPKFGDTINLRPHMLVLNKMDLVDPKHNKMVEDTLKDQTGINKVLYTNCKSQIDRSIKKKFLPEVLDLVQSVPRCHRSNVEEYNLLVIGVPNVGKSSLINALRRIHLKKGKASRVGAVSGITRSVEEKVKVSESPKVYVYDSPGILAPKISDLEVGMKLAVCGTLKEHLVGEDFIANYLLYRLNKREELDYVNYFNLPEPTDNIIILLAHITKENEYFQSIKSSTGTGNVYETRPNFVKAAQRFLTSFHLGELGKVNLDIDMCHDYYTSMHN